MNIDNKILSDTLELNLDRMIVNETLAIIRFIQNIPYSKEDKYIIASGLGSHLIGEVDIKKLDYTRICEINQQVHREAFPL